ncbi:cytochrome P450 [Amycolatopsis mongoliensis]|uniref:Cytochrome P450 n=1 Tax=Amycolatopsis mongoliensis TaxID=715475 RepID=A0A9Y2JM72_9PSEU|nr:cytochrome P450 [Amycolatopsis sp. 4-36]WIY01085.1 cytochrome P450 [Amycolatopsis sp. 4-36]
MTATTTVDVDLFTDDVLDDPYPAYRALRDAGPIVWIEPQQCWAVTRYDEVRATLEDWESFTSDQGTGLNDAVNSALTGTLLASSPPLHDKLRGVLAERLSPRGLRSLGDQITRRTREIVEPLVERGSFDVVGDLARVLPPTIVADLVGIPDDVRPQLVPWADAIFNMMGPADKSRTFSGAALVEEQFAWLANVDGSMLTEGSWGRAIYDAAAEGRLDPEQAPTLLSAYTSAAMDTTINALGSAVWLFAEAPAQWRRLRTDRSLIPDAFNEVLRIESPLQFFTRVATRDVDAADTRIRAGERIMVIYGSANRDERHWGPSAADFEITRDASDHLAFGYGLHGCVGQGLARLEAHAVFDTLADLVTDFHIETPPTRHLNSAVRGLDQLTVSVR